LLAGAILKRIAEDRTSKEIATNTVSATASSWIIAPTTSLSKHFKMIQTWPIQTRKRPPGCKIHSN